MEIYLVVSHHGLILQRANWSLLYFCIGVDQLKEMEDLDEFLGQMDKVYLGI